MNLKNQNTSPDYDLSDLRELSSGKETFFNEMIQIFISSTNEGVEKMKLELNKQNWNSIAEAAHKMLGPVSHIGAHQLRVILKNLENDIRNHNKINDIAFLIEKAEKETNRIVKLLENESLK